MNILFLAFRDLSNPFIGGGDIYIGELARGCARRGHSVTIITSRFLGSRKEESIEGVHVIRLGNGFTMFAKVFKYYLKHLRGRFDVIVEEIIGGPRIPFFGSLYIKAKLVGVMQQRHKEIFKHEFRFPIAGFLSILERFLVLLYRDKTIIVNSSKTKQELCELGFSEKQMCIIHPGLHEWFFAATTHERPLAFDARSARVVCLAKTRRYKLVDYAIRAMKNVCKNMPQSQLVIAGRMSDVDTKYQGHLHNLVEELDIRNNVLFRGDISETDKIELLRTSRALVLPSAVEGFGIVVIEANACGTPAIVSDCVPRDAAIDGYNVIVVPCYNVGSLATNILLLLTDKAVWTKMSANARQWAKKFTWQRSIEDFVSVIENVYLGIRVFAYD